MIAEHLNLPNEVVIDVLRDQWNSVKQMYMTSDEVDYIGVRFPYIGKFVFYLPSLDKIVLEQLPSARRLKGRDNETEKRIFDILRYV